MFLHLRKANAFTQDRDVPRRLEPDLQRVIETLRPGTQLRSTDHFRDITPTWRHSFTGPDSFQSFLTWASGAKLRPRGTRVAGRAVHSFAASSRREGQTIGDFNAWSFTPTIFHVSLSAAAIPDRHFPDWNSWT